MGLWKNFEKVNPSVWIIGSGFTAIVFGSIHFVSFLDRANSPADDSIEQLYKAPEQKPAEKIENSIEKNAAPLDPLIAGNQREKITASANPRHTSSANTSHTSSLGAEKAPASSGIRLFDWPVRPDSLAQQNAPYDGSLKSLEIPLPLNSPILAADSGVVIYAGDGLADLGKSMLIKHDNGFVTVYGHLSDFNYGRGDFVKNGAIVGLSGNSGSAEEPKLHFEIRVNSAPVEILRYLKPQPIEQ